MKSVAEIVASYRLVMLSLWLSGLIRFLSHSTCSPAVKPPILSDACIRVRIKYFYSFMTFGPY